ncbi:hypothetical protein B0T17DRAFT_523405, partial [Bombardia bombarda]
MYRERIESASRHHGTTMYPFLIVCHRRPSSPTWHQCRYVNITASPSAQPDEPTNKSAAPGLAEQPTPAISLSERLWNAAY